MVGFEKLGEFRSSIIVAKWREDMTLGANNTFLPDNEYDPGVPNMETGQVSQVTPMLSPCGDED